MRIGIAASVVGMVILAALPDIQGQQRSNGANRPANRPGDGARGGSRPRNETPPLPVAPNMNPIQPIIRYEGWGTPTVVIQSNVPGRTTSGAPIPFQDRKRSESVAVIGGGGYWGPDYYYGEPYPEQPYLSSPPVSPGPYYPPQPPSVSSASATAVAPLPTGLAPAVNSDPNRIITPPKPERTVEPPAIGTSRAEVLLRYGQPWGSLRAGTKETLYFSRGLTVVIEDGKVSEVR